MPLQLFQLRSIEQNELAIVAESQNKAILVFTGVTIIFLPLSFLSSYFGMNIQGVVRTEHDQVYFWKLCGSVAAIVIALTITWAFRQRIADVLLWRGIRRADRARTQRDYEV